MLRDAAKSTAHEWLYRVCVAGSLLCSIATAVTASEVRVGFIGSYRPVDVPREEIVTVIRQGETLSLDELPRYIHVGDSIQIKRPDGSVTLLFANGDRKSIEGDKAVFIVPLIAIRKDLKSIFKRPSQQSPRDRQMLTVKIDPDAPLDYEPFKVEFVDGKPYVGATLSMFPSNPTRPFSGFISKSPPDLSLGLGFANQQGAGMPLMFFADEDMKLHWLGRAAMTELTLNTPDGRVSLAPSMGTREATFDSAWLRPGWATVLARDAGSDEALRNVLIVEREALRRCPFTGGEIGVTVDVAAVCEAWRVRPHR